MKHREKNTVSTPRNIESMSFKRYRMETSPGSPLKCSFTGGFLNGDISLSVVSKL